MYSTILLGLVFLILNTEIKGNEEEEGTERRVYKFYYSTDILNRMKKYSMELPFTFFVREIRKNIEIFSLRTSINKEMFSKNSNITCYVSNELDMLEIEFINTNEMDNMIRTSHMNALSNKVHGKYVGIKLLRDRILYMYTYDIITNGISVTRDFASFLSKNGNEKYGIQTVSTYVSINSGNSTDTTQDHAETYVIVFMIVFAVIVLIYACYISMEDYTDPSKPLPSMSGEKLVSDVGKEYLNL